jgi:hypothetical protein
MISEARALSSYLCLLAADFEKYGALAFAHAHLAM